MKLTIEQIIEAVNGKCIHNPGQVDTIEEILTDSRKKVQNGLFIPLKGERFDAHQFLGDIYDKGVRVTLTMEEQIRDTRLVTILVSDTHKALLDLASYYRKRFAIPVIGVTGSVGKTSTKDLIAAALSGKLNTHKTEGNFNNDIGVPLTLFKLDGENEASVIEMGMNHFGEISVLTQVALPDIAVITNIGTSHIENLGSREGILKAKLEILEGLNKEGILITNGDNDLLGELHDLPVKTIFYGLSSKNDYWAEKIVTHEHYISAVVHAPTKDYDIVLEALGEHMVYNSLAAIAVAEQVGLSPEEIKKGLSLYKATKMRMEISSIAGGLTLIDDTYNASPDSMKAALEVLVKYPKGKRKVAVLGDMLEMGDFAPKLHFEVGAYAAKAQIDALIAIGDRAKNIYEGYRAEGGKWACYFRTKEAFFKELKNCIGFGDTILFKASRGLHFEEILEEVRRVNKDEK